VIKWIYDYNLSPEDNVQKDFSLFKSFEEFEAPLVVRVHTFSHYCATTGYLSHLGDFTERSFAKNEVPLLKRVSGGSVAFHGEDLCMSFFFKTGLIGDRTYRYCIQEIRDIVADVLEEGTGISVDTRKTICFNRGESEYCLERTDESDIYVGLIKIAGFAGRVRKSKFLIHLQINSPGWQPAILKHLWGIGFNITDEYLTMKKFVFSTYFLENIKEKIERTYSSLFLQDGSIFGCLSG
jgi:lipoate-protein ligase A